LSHQSTGFCKQAQEVTAIRDGQEIVRPPRPRPKCALRFWPKRKRSVCGASKQRIPIRIARGVSYAQAGLLDDAEREFRALLAANSQLPIARKLLRNIEARRRAK